MLFLFLEEFQPHIKFLQNPHSYKIVVVKRILTSTNSFYAQKTASERYRAKTSRFSFSSDHNP